MKPLFMWAGGKKKMLKKYNTYLPEAFSTYVEPFLGGGAMFVWAYQKNPDALFVLNDINKGIMSIYNSIRNDVENFTIYMDDMSQRYMPLKKEDRKKFYYDLREEHAFNYKKWSKTQEAAVLYFLMKTCFNGIWQVNKNTNNRFGTPSGLLSQKKKVYDKNNVLEWNKALQRCLLLTESFEKTAQYCGKGSYVFLDPPYRGTFTHYGTDFDDKLQESVISFMNASNSRGAYVMLSNRDIGDNFFKDRKGQHELVYFNVTYTAGRRKRNQDGTHSAKKAREVLIIAK